MIVTFKENNFHYYSLEYKLAYITENRQLLRLYGVFSMAFAMILLIDKKAKFIAALLCCAIFVQGMLIYDLQEESSWLSIFIYDYCDELIILIWLAMMVIAKDGLIRAFNSISLLLREYNVYSIRSVQNTSSRRKD